MSSPVSSGVQYTPGLWKHQPWCPWPLGHNGDCWEANNRALGIEPGPAITVVCAECEYIKANGGFGPPHNASPKCESGGHSHCTCSVCFD